MPFVPDQQAPRFVPDQPPAPPQGSPEAARAAIGRAGLSGGASYSDMAASTAQTDQDEGAGLAQAVSAVRAMAGGALNAFDAANSGQAPDPARNANLGLTWKGNPTATAVLGGVGGLLAPIPGGKAGEPAVAADAAAGALDISASARAGERLGMQRTPGQITGNTSLRQAEAAMGSNPLTSGPIAAIRKSNQTILNSKWAQAIGEDGATKLDSPVLDSANTRLGDVFDRARDSRLRSIDPSDFQAKLDAINAKYEGLTPYNHIEDAPLVGPLKKLVMDQGGAATGAQLGNKSSLLGRLAYQTGRSGQGDYAAALREVKDLADEYVQQGLTGAEREEYQQARSQYRALSQLTGRNGNLNIQTGDVNGGAMGRYLQQTDKKGYTFNGNHADHYDATRFAQGHGDIVGDSGTATRSFNIGDLANIKVSLLKAAVARAYVAGGQAINAVNGLGNAAARRLFKTAAQQNPRVIATLQSLQQQDEASNGQGAAAQ